MLSEPTNSGRMTSSKKGLENIILNAERSSHKITLSLIS